MSSSSRWSWGRGEGSTERFFWLKTMYMLVVNLPVRENMGRLVP